MLPSPYHRHDLSVATVGARRGGKPLEMPNLCTKAYHSGTVWYFALWYRILQFDNSPRVMPQSESKNSIQVIERMTRLLDALANSSAPASLKHLAQCAALHRRRHPRRRWRPDRRAVGIGAGGAHESKLVSPGERDRGKHLALCRPRRIALGRVR
jgi:hypothetical protein